jgi:hydrogenase maturation protein HypF
MRTYHIHINGQVQGVGFRPFVYKLAHDLSIKGSVSNCIDGVHIYCNTSEETAQLFFKKIVSSPPENAIISYSIIERFDNKIFTDFIIEHSTKEKEYKTSLLLTPDIAICTDCKAELVAHANKRFLYPFITCLNCGPRYSIIKDLPYDRENTTMSELMMCDRCLEEYNNPYDRRHFSQTNSCNDCAIKMHFYETKDHKISSDKLFILNRIDQELHNGKILAVKGIGGYLLLCDATHESTIKTLRKRKHRLSKPFALLYPDLDLLKKDVHLTGKETKALQSKEAPIVLCSLKNITGTGICVDEIAPGLDKIGVMLPYSGLLLLISIKYGKPLVATSGNLSGSPILFTDEEALNNLFTVADHIITYDRDIVVPQDDSVIGFSEKHQQKIIIRRSRGMSPNYYPNPFSDNKNILAMGGELKGAFAFLHEKNLYVSQFLGDQGSLESQNSYVSTLKHTQNLLSSKPEVIIVDKHPGYTVSHYGKELAQELNIQTIEVQHHKAHFASVLAENNLLQSSEPVLGIIWDGIGFGDDEQIWGGEIFLLDNQSMERIFHFSYFPYLLGDKMSKEPRFSALSLLQEHPEKMNLVEKYFSEKEWKFYQQFIQKEKHLQTSSMGRFLDGLSSILDVQQINNYEGEAAMKLEVLARSCKDETEDCYTFGIKENIIEHSVFLKEIFFDIENGIEKSIIAKKIFNSLAGLILQISDKTGVNKIAFSGGVFQNAFLVDTIIQLLSEKKQLIFHQQLSPNDECIGFGQIAYQQLLTKNIIPCV